MATRAFIALRSTFIEETTVGGNNLALDVDSGQGPCLTPKDKLGG